MGYLIRRRLVAWGFERPFAVPAIVMAAVWTVAIASALWRSSGTLLALELAPVAGALALLFARGAVPPPYPAILGWAAIVSAGAYTATHFAGDVAFALAVPAVLFAAVVATRFPDWSMIVVFLATGFYGTAQTFLISPTPLADGLLGGLWIGTVWTYLLNRRARRLRVWPGVVVLGLYVMLSAAEIVTSPQLVPALQSFRASTWYLMAFLLIAYAPIPRARLQRMATGFILVTLAVGAYAVFRWRTGQSPEEIANALAQTDNNVANGKVRLFGSFVVAKEMVDWLSAAIPFMLAYATTFAGKRRVLTLVAIALCTTALLAADVRSSLVAIAVASLVVLVLQQFAKGFPGLHLGTTVGIALAVAAIGVGGFVIALGGESSTAHRYQVLLTDPTRDPSFQGRLTKWRDALVDIDNHPLGAGLGTSGSEQKRYGRFVNISNREIDSGFLKIALEQGLGVTIFYAIGLALLTVGLARRGLAAPDRVDAGLAIGAVGTLVAYTIIMFVNTVVEGFPALAAWMFVGVGAAGATR